MLMQRKLLTILLLSMALCGRGQDSVRPFKAWEGIAFCSYDKYHPFRYIRADNNWELLLALRTPQTAKELAAKGIRFNASQLDYLCIGGLVEAKARRFHTTLPIFDERQTLQIRRLSRRLAEETFAETEGDYRRFVAWLHERGCRDNAFSLLFSYLLDGRTWPAIIPSKASIAHHPTWDGVAYVMFEPRKMVKTGTNSYGALHVTWSDSLKTWPNGRMIDAFEKQFAQHGKLTDAETIDEWAALDVVDRDGNLTIPVLKDGEDKELDKLSRLIVDKNAEGLKRGVDELKRLTNLSDDNYARVVLFHEMMWDIIDLLKEKRVISMPSILQASDAPRRDFGKVAFVWMR